MQVDAFFNFLACGQTSVGWPNMFVKETQVVKRSFHCSLVRAFITKQIILLLGSAMWKASFDMTNRER